MTSQNNKFPVLVHKMSLHNVAGVWCVAGAARSIGTTSVVMVKGKAFDTNPHSEDNVRKKMHSGYGVLTFTSDRGVAGGASGGAAPGGRVQGLAK